MFGGDIGIGHGDEAVEHRVHHLLTVKAIGNGLARARIAKEIGTVNTRGVAIVIGGGSDSKGQPFHEWASAQNRTAACPF